MHVFYNQDQQTVDQIKGLLETEQFDAAKEIIHRIKGTAGNLGFQTIFNLATKLEKAIHHQPHKEQLLKQFSVFEKCWQHLMTAINNMHCKRKLKPTNPINIEAKAFYHSELINQLTENLIKQSTHAKQDFQALQQLYPQLAIMKQIEVAINQLNYKTALQLLKTIDSSQDT